jgi:hypothetical protein
MAQRFTKSQRQKLKQLILIAVMHRYTEAETLQFIKESLGYEIIWNKHKNTLRHKTGK